VRLLCTLEVLTILLCEACFDYILLGEALYFNSAIFVRLLRTLKVSWILLCNVYFVRLLCTLEVLARLLCSACFVHLLPGGALYSNFARLLLHTRSLGDITLQCLLCLSFTWRGFILQLSEASFAHSKSRQAYFAVPSL
jgi:hypothetical protein